MGQMSIEEFLCGAVNLNLVKKCLLEQVISSLSDNDQIQKIKLAADNSRNFEDTANLLGGILVYGYNHMEPVIESFYLDNYTEERMELKGIMSDS